MIEDCRRTLSNTCFFIRSGFKKCTGDRLVNSRSAESVVTGLAANDAKLIITSSWLLKGDIK